MLHARPAPRVAVGSVGVSVLYFAATNAVPHCVFGQ